MTPPSPAAQPALAFRERLSPGLWLFLTLLLLIPAVMLTVTPINAAFALPIAVGVYVIVAGSLVLMAPVVTVAAGRLSAGRATIPVDQLGRVELLNADELRAAIGPGADARTHLVVRGYIHTAIRVEITDPTDPTPYWIITTRRPEALRSALVSTTHPADR